jgi:DnaK suppressor protein
VDEQPILESARAVEGRVSQLEGAEHQLILDALQRLRDETYGFCLTCGKQIANLRLKAVPWAAECARCARSHEPAAAAAEREHGKDRMRQAGATLSDLLADR